MSRLIKETCKQCSAIKDYDDMIIVKHTGDFFCNEQCAQDYLDDLADYLADRVKGSICEWCDNPASDLIDATIDNKKIKICKSCEEHFREMGE